MPKVNTQFGFARYFSASSFWISECGTLGRPGCSTSTTWTKPEHRCQARAALGGGCSGLRQRPRRSWRAPGGGRMGGTHELLAAHEAVGQELPRADGRRGGRHARRARRLTTAAASASTGLKKPGALAAQRRRSESIAPINRRSGRTQTQPRSIRAAAHSRRSSARHPTDSPESVLAPPMQIFVKVRPPAAFQATPPPPRCGSARPRPAPRALQLSAFLSRRVAWRAQCRCSSAAVRATDPDGQDHHTGGRGQRLDRECESEDPGQGGDPAGPAGARQARRAMGGPSCPSHRPSFVGAARCLT